MTKYCLKVTQVGELINYDESIALFSDAMPHSAMYDCAKTCFFDMDNVNEVRCIDLDTGEVIFEINVDTLIFADDKPDVDESNYDPYIGSDAVEDDRLDAFCIESGWQY